VLDAATERGLEETLAVAFAMRGVMITGATIIYEARNTSEYQGMNIIIKIITHGQLVFL
jgi:hypothetical protein